MLNDFIHYDTISRGVWPHEGHAYSVALDHKVLCLLGPQIYMGLIIASSPKISFQNTIKPLKKRHIGGRAFVSSREVVLYKTD